ncbi:ATP-binding protein [Thomasclavelia sp.]|uniref:ATP-binding protein n=1 Tax=Thomasclavelia sp. TaxID=3025757 RepID=UPI0025E2BFFD|nr:ATP-binding protein [Thomasclavelia sp.]
MKISIPKSRAVVATLQGKMLRRRLKANGEPENVPMYPYEITTRLSDLSLLDFSFQTVANANINDFDDNEISRLRMLIQRSNGDATLLDLDNEELEKALCLAKEDNGVLVPTVTGLLLIGKEEKINEYIPTAKATFQVLEGTNIRKNEEYGKSLLSMLELFETNFDAWNPEHEIEEGLLRMSAPEFSKKAFREALINAFCHRDYTMLGSVRVAIDDDGLTISNPGGFIEGVSIENLLTVEPHGRNKTLADALKRIGLAEKTGRGIDRIYEGSILFGRPWPDYSESTSAMVKLFIQRAKPDFAFAKMILDEQNRIGRLLHINSLLILSCINTERRINLKRIIELTHISESKAKATVEKLVESGLIEASGQGKNRFYLLSARVYNSNHNIVGYVRQTDIDEIRYEELILKLARKSKKGICRKDVSDLLNISKDQAYRLLKKLVNNGELIRVGNGSNTKYQIVKK